MTTEQKIKELEKRIECEQALIKNCISHQENLRAEIADLKKPKYNLRAYNKSNGGYDMDNSRYNTFLDRWNRDYYGNQRKIFDALANFAAHNDQTEKDRAWNGKNEHWCVIKNNIDNKYEIYIWNKYSIPNVVYFSTEELAEAALQMLKDEKLIIV